MRNEKVRESGRDGVELKWGRLREEVGGCMKGKKRGLAIPLESKL